MPSYGSQGLEVSWELGEEIFAVGVAGEAGQALLHQHVRGLGEGRTWSVETLHGMFPLVKSSQLVNMKRSTSFTWWIPKTNDSIRANLEITGLLAEHGIVVVAFKLVRAQTCSTLTKCYKLKLEIQEDKNLEWVSRINLLFFNFKSCLRQKIIRITWKKARACSTWPFLISSTPAIPRGCEKQITSVERSF